MKILNHELEIRFHSRQPWSYFRIHKHEMYRHLVWGKLSIIFGQPHLEEIGICAMCESTEVREVSAGDEGWTVCPDCGSIEQGYEYITIEQAEKRGIL